MFLLVAESSRNHQSDTQSHFGVMVGSRVRPTSPHTPKKFFTLKLLQKGSVYTQASISPPGGSTAEGAAETCLLKFLFENKPDRNQ